MSALLLRGARLVGRGDGPYASPALAAEMERVRSGSDAGSAADSTVAGREAR